MRDPFQAQEPIPVGLVSNTYRIIQHGEVLDAAIEFVGRVVRWTVDHIHVSMTPNGERFLMRVDFGDAYRTSPDGKDVGLQLVCRNAVDGTAALRAHLGWFRFVCANGLTVGVTLGKVRLPHTARADLSGVFRALESQMESVEADRKSMAEWSRTKVSQDAIRRWVDLDLVAAWRPLAACRVWHICTSGKDAAFMPPFQKVPPSHRRVKLLEPVAGAQQHADNLYAVAQAMSWVASHRCDVEEVDDMQRRIGTLLNVLKLMQR